MREKKFRAWDKDAEFMLYSDKQEDDYFFEFVDGRLRAFGITLGPASTDSPPQPETYELSEPMDFVGLKDGHGQAVYEGDIVAIDGGAEPIKTEVFFKDGCFCVDMLGNSVELKYYINMKFCETEIIGNIHETPELLAKDKNS